MDEYLEKLIENNYYTKINTNFFIIIKILTFLP